MLDIVTRSVVHFPLSQSYILGMSCLFWVIVMCIYVCHALYISKLWFAVLSFANTVLCARLTIWRRYPLKRDLLGCILDIVLCNKLCQLGWPLSDHIHLCKGVHQMQVPWQIHAPPHLHNPHYSYQRMNCKPISTNNFFNPQPHTCTYGTYQFHQGQL